MTARRVRLRQCRDKHRHLDRDAALTHLFHLVKNTGAQRSALRAYRCSTCGFWHVGHQPRRYS